MQIPPNTYGRIAGRSSLALKRMIGIGGGVIDSDYRGNIKVIVFNHHQENIFNIRKGDRIAQIIFESIITPRLIECHPTMLGKTERGNRGLGNPNNN